MKTGDILNKIHINSGLLALFPYGGSMLVCFSVQIAYYVHVMSDVYTAKYFPVFLAIIGAITMQSARFAFTAVAVSIYRKDQKAATRNIWFSVAFTIIQAVEFILYYMDVESSGASFLIFTLFMTFVSLPLEYNVLLTIDSVESDKSAQDAIRSGRVEYKSLPDERKRVLLLNTIEEMTRENAGTRPAWNLIGNRLGVSGATASSNYKRLCEKQTS